MAKRKNRPNFFSEEEIQLILNTPPEQLRIIAIALGRDLDVIRAKKWNLENKDKVKKSRVRFRSKRKGKTESKNRWNRWSKLEEELIMKSNKSDLELSVELGRTADSITMKRTRLLNDAKRNRDSEQQLEGNDGQTEI